MDIADLEDIEREECLRTPHTYCDSLLFADLTDKLEKISKTGIVEEKLGFILTTAQIHFFRKSFIGLWDVSSLHRAPIQNRICCYSKEAQLCWKGAWQTNVPGISEHVSGIFGFNQFSLRWLRSFPLPCWALGDLLVSFSLPDPI